MFESNRHYVLEGPEPPPDFRLTEFGARERVAVEQLLCELEQSLSLRAIFVALARTLRGNTVLIGDLDFAIELIAGFVSEERRMTTSESYEIHFELRRASAWTLGLWARLTTPGKPGSSSYGCSIRRLGERMFLFRNW